MKGPSSAGEISLKTEFTHSSVPSPRSAASSSSCVASFVVCPRPERNAQRCAIRGVFRRASRFSLPAVFRASFRRVLPDRGGSRSRLTTSSPRESWRRRCAIRRLAPRAQVSPIRSIATAASFVRAFRRLHACRLRISGHNGTADSLSTPASRGHCETI